MADAVARGEADAGIVIDGAGHRLGDRGEQDPRHPRGDGDDRDDRALLARAQRRNVLTLGATLVSADEARAIVTTWLTTPMREPRYIRAAGEDSRSGDSDRDRRQVSDES